MFKKIALCVLLATVAGCDYELPTFKQIKWATVDSNKLRQAVTARLKAESSPASDEAREAAQRDGSKLRQQISELERTATKACQSQVMSTKPNSSYPQPGAYGQAAMAISADQASAYSQCIQSIRGDRLIADLQEKLNVLTNEAQEQGRKERALSEQALKVVNDSAREYAKANHYELVLSKQSDSIIYNKSEMVVDVTDGLLEYMAKHK